MVEETERASKNQAAMAGQTDTVRRPITELTAQRYALQGAVDAPAHRRVRAVQPHQDGGGPRVLATFERLNSVYHGPPAGA